MSGDGFEPEKHDKPPSRIRPVSTDSLLTGLNANPGEHRDCTFRAATARALAAAAELLVLPGATGWQGRTSWP